MKNPANVNVGNAPLFESFFLAGFECSEHRLRDGRRLDLLASTRHDEFAAADYARLRDMGVTTCREGVSWVRCEPRPGRYDFTSLLPRIQAAAQNVRVIWDIMHFGWPEHIDVFAADFPERFAEYAHALARFLSKHTSEPWTFTPINEMSFLSWAGGDAARMNPFATGRGVELKVQLVAATIAAISSIRCVLPNARFMQAEPLIHVVPDPAHPEAWEATGALHRAQYQALEMLLGRQWPRLGGNAAQLDIVGVNFYSDNQFTLDRATVERGDARYKPLSQLLMEAWELFDRRPIVISETGAEGEARADWLRYVAEECMLALANGCELHGVTLYPILNHPGWLDDRHCHNGLWDYADDTGARAIDDALAAEIRRQTPRLVAARAQMLARRTVFTSTQPLAE